MTQPEGLGIDIGGVIIARTDKRDTSFFTENYLTTPSVSHSFEAISNLVKNRFPGRSYLVSKCGPEIQEKSLSWLSAHEFFQHTGISEDNVYFCLERSGKVEIAKKLGLTHIVDDRLEVLGYLYEAGIPNLYLLNGRSEEIREYSNYIANVNHTPNWYELERLLLHKAVSK